MYKIGISFLWFISVFLFIYTYQFFFVLCKCKKSNYKKIPVEAQYIIFKFKLDIKKIDFNKLINMTNLVAALDIALVYSVITYFIENVYLSLFYSLLLLIPIILITYNLVGKWYIKRYLNH